MNESMIGRRTFVAQAGAAGAVLTISPVTAQRKPEEKLKSVRVGVIGCGSVSRAYLPHLAECQHADLVSTCDIIPERAKTQAEKYRIPNSYPHIDQMLAGAEFDLLVNLTDMQEHERLN